MRKAKVVAIVCGMIVSCLIGGFAVVEAATVKLDDSSTELVDYADYYEPTGEMTTEATTVTSIETTTKKIAATTEDQNQDKATGEVTEDTQESTEAEDATESTTTTETTTTETTASETTTTESTTEATTTATAPAATAAPVTTAAQTTAAPVPVAPATTPAPAAAPEDLDAEMTNPPAPFETCAVITEPATEATVAVSYGTAVTVSESDYILLCNAVAHEAGANSISVTEKAKVVEVIMNRVSSPNFPNTIYGVLTQRYQFSGSSTYVNLNSYSYKVTSMVKEAVDLYLSDPSQFSEGYLYFTGDGAQNHFR